MAMHIRNTDGDAHLFFYPLYLLPLTPMRLFYLSSTGKTFTMMGDQSKEGIIPRIVKELFDALDEKMKKDSLLKVREVRGERCSTRV